MPNCYLSPIRSNKEIAKDCMQMILYAPKIAMEAKAGQFLHIRCQDALEPTLRRPISIHMVDRKEGLVYLLYKVVGKGTKILAQKKEGEFLDVLGALGNGFSFSQDSKAIALVAGGIGVAPLFFLAQELLNLGHKVDFIIGASNKDLLIPSEYLQMEELDLYFATDDGSYGYKGLITSLIYDLVSKGKKYDYIYGCGPLPMLKALSLLAKELKIRGQISLEEKMACGMGACLSCVCKIKDKDASDNFTYERVCTEGPVFDLKEVLMC